MTNELSAASMAEANPQVVLQAVLALNLMSFTEFAFGEVRGRIAECANQELDIVRAGHFAGGKSKFRPPDLRRVWLEGAIAKLSGTSMRFT